MKLAGGFKDFLFSPLLEEDSHFDLYFSIGLVQPPTRKALTEVFSLLASIFSLQMLFDAATLHEQVGSFGGPSLGESPG